MITSHLYSFFPPFHGMMKWTPVMHFKSFWKNESISCYRNMPSEYYKNWKLHWLTFSVILLTLPITLLNNLRVKPIHLDRLCNICYRSTDSNLSDLTPLHKCVDLNQIWLYPGYMLSSLDRVQKIRKPLPTLLASIF